jgi:hypothetical protein
MYKVKIDLEALTDIQGITIWYSEQQSGLGRRFQSTVVKQINSLARNPHIYAIRYQEIRCMIVKKFPYMVHFHINENFNIVEVLAIISTNRNPKIWTIKTGENI